jgi:Toprim-like
MPRINPSIHARHHFCNTTRGIALGIAMRAGVGYLSYDLLARLDAHQRHRIDRWADRMGFPLLSPLGTGFIGRSLYGWQPGMDENRHKDLLEQAAGPKRWSKTNPAGWFSAAFDGLAEQVILVEGGFDRLALVAAGLAPQAVVALVGTAGLVSWLPGQVKSVVLALDGDRGGQAASQRLAQQFSQAGLRVATCWLPQDRWGKDWNERWRLLGARGLQPLLEGFSGKERFSSSWMSLRQSAYVAKTRHPNALGVEDCIWLS